ncbi:hypothetical protein KF840_20620 [bacterium]|nr:hypothetical protein [bacterium]
MRLAGAIVVTTLWWMSAAAAQGPPAACDADLQRFCASARPGGGRMMQCLRQHGSELSPACQDAISSMGRGGGPAAGGRSMGGALRRDCEADIARLCKDVAAGQGRIGQCLLGHADQLSPACAAALASRPHRRLTPGAAPPPPTAEP